MGPKAVDLFCGIGVGALGFVKAGFEIVAAVDKDPDACKIYEKNIGIEPMVGDLKTISGKEILGRARLNRGELDLCVGCVPCQSFSSIGRTRLKKGGRDRRKSLLRVFAERIEEILPKGFVLENVKGLTIGGNKRFLREFLRRMELLGYYCVYGVLDAADYGVAQHRKRLIVIGSRIRKPSLPKYTHSHPKKKEGVSWKTVRTAIGDLPPLRSGQSYSADQLHSASIHTKAVLEIIRNIPRNGGSRRELPLELWLPCHLKLAEEGQRGAESVYGRMKWSEPSPTVTSGFLRPSCGRFVHPTQNRGMTLREAARLQSIPDDFWIAGGKEKMAFWIGNGFPTDFAETIAQQARVSVLSN